MQQSNKQQYVEALAAYIRVSTQEQAKHGLSIAAQMQKLQEYAEANNCRIVEWYIDDGVSGRKLISKRPELQRMIHDAKAKKFDRIVFIRLDRFFRSVSEYHSCMKIIDPIIWTATEEKYDLTTANGRAFVNMKLTIAELEADTTGERIIITNDYKVKTGLPLGGTRCQPFCYEVLPDPDHPKRKTVVKAKEYEEAMMDLIRRFEATASIRGSMAYINQKYGLQLGYNAVRNTLKNEKICGSYRGNPEYCEPYITRERFDNLQKLISRNPRTTVGRTFIFAGLLICPVCGRKLTGNTHTTKVRGKEYTYHNYRCPGHRIGKKCPYNVAFFEAPLERDLLLNMRTYIERKRSEEASAWAGEKVYRYDLEELQSELERINYSWHKGRIKSAEEYDRKFEAVSKQIELATAERAQTSYTADYDGLSELFTEGWQDIYNILDPEKKRAFWRKFISEIRVDRVGEEKKITDIKFF